MGFTYSAIGSFLIVLVEKAIVGTVMSKDCMGLHTHGVRVIQGGILRKYCCMIMLRKS